MNSVDKSLLKIVGLAIGEDLLNEVVFVGGVTTSIYIENDPEPNTTPTEDVDLIVNITSKLEYELFEKKISKQGFKRNLSNPGPLCRFELNGIVVDFMPIEESILGFSNKWYKNGFDAAEYFQLDEIKIKILSYPYFLATKIEAFNSRGKMMRLYDSKDFEDIVVTMAGRNNIEKDLENLPTDISKIVNDLFLSFLDDESILKESMIATLQDYGSQVANSKAQMLIRLFKS